VNLGRTTLSCSGYGRLYDYFGETAGSKDRRVWVEFLTKAHMLLTAFVLGLNRWVQSGRSAPLGSAAARPRGLTETWQCVLAREPHGVDTPTLKPVRSPFSSQYGPEF